MLLQTDAQGGPALFDIAGIAGIATGSTPVLVGTHIKEQNSITKGLGDLCITFRMTRSSS